MQRPDERVWRRAASDLGARGRQSRRNADLKAVQLGERAAACRMPEFESAHLGPPTEHGRAEAEK
eukprot:3124169-Prymnesium_polylepis.1